MRFLSGVAILRPPRLMNENTSRNQVSCKKPARGPTSNGILAVFAVNRFRMSATKLSSAPSMMAKSQPSSSSASALRRSTTRALALGRMNAAVSGRQRVGDHEGFENLRNYIKQGAEFSKELVAALNERADLETNYR